VTKRKNYMRNKRNTNVPTRVVGVRADEFFWDSVEEVAHREGVSRNGLIIRVLADYIMREHKNGE
jgi:predicted DNA-binding ribbon-helix-helix protein